MSEPSPDPSAVHPALRRYVVSSVAYDVDLGGPGVHRGLPSTTVTLVLPVGEPLDVSWAGRPGTRRRGWSSVSGLHTGPAAIHHEGHQRGVQLALTPQGARALLGLPAAELAGELLELPEVAAPLRHLPEQLAEEADRARWPRLVEQALLVALASRGEPAPRAAVGRALARLTGGAAVAEVAAEVGYSRRHLGTMVRAEVGLAPKQLQRVARFQRSRALLRPGTSLARVAAATGYADQAHLAREWRSLAGCPPSTWLREEFPFVQDLAGDPAAG